MEEQTGQSRATGERAGGAPAVSDRALAAWEIITIAVSVLVAEWVVLSVGGESRLLMLAPVGLALGFMFYSHRQRGETARQLGFRLDNFGRATRLQLLLFAAPALALVLFGWLSGNLDFGRWRGGQSILGLPVLGALWGLLQQYALQGFIHRRAQIVFGAGWKSVLVVGVLFAFLHFPNPWLTLATFLGGLVWAYAYWRVPNLYAAGLTHGLMTWVLVASVPPPVLHNLRVGYKFFA
ncbi:MAG TPA: CPBP family intramembrane glutamic endopeptidase [Pyrinomonadaceae bacterium]|nr:CPBP family intramembrane glutamic endopeptidase [Pyrinomonadaceae bacterium]